MDISLGQIVLSKAGRDKGKKFIVIKDIDLAYVLITDGELRKIEKPKKKKLKHLELMDTVIDEIGNKLKSNQKVTNAEIRKALDNYQGVPDK